MSEAELAAKIDYVCANIQQLENQDNDEIRYLCEMLIDYRNINTSRLAELAWEHGLTYYQTIYKDAPPQVVEEMLNRLRQDDLKPWDGCKLLLCLAEAGGPAVHQAFWELQQQPRSWSRQLSTTPAVFATYGGWSFDSQGRWTPTNFAECYPLVKGTAAEKAESPVKIAVPAGEGEICEHCGTPLVNLLEIDGHDPRLAFLGLDGVVRAKCCPNCLIYVIDNLFCRYQLDGDSQLYLLKAIMTEVIFQLRSLQKWCPIHIFWGRVRLRRAMLRIGTEVPPSAAWPFGGRGLKLKPARNAASL